MRHLQTDQLTDANSNDGVNIEVPPIPDVEHKQQPVGRVGKPEDIAAWAVFLAERGLNL